LKVADQQHSEVHSRRDRGAAEFLGVVRRAKLFAEAVEVALAQKLIELPVERVPRRFRQLPSPHPFPLIARLRFSDGHWLSFIQGNRWQYNTRVKSSFSTDC